MAPSEIQAVLADYGAVLGEKTAIGVARDAKSLPYPKAKIKMAILGALRLSHEHSMKEQLKSGYLLIADFQELSNDQIAALRLWNKTLSSSTENMTLAEIKEEAKVMTEIGDKVTAIQSRCAADMELLSQELKAAGF